MLQFKMTNHILEDRLNRMVHIGRIVGFGDEIVMKAKDPDVINESVLALTDTGIMLVLGEDEKFLITAYLPSESQVKKLEEASGKKLTTKMWAKVIKNQRIAKMVNQYE